MRGSDASRVAELAGVVRRYGATVALDGVDLAVCEGEVLALLGQNGAGKSTAIGCWLGLLDPHQGSVRLFGRSPQLLAVRRLVGVMLQDAQMPGQLKVRELLAQARSYYAAPRPEDECIALAGLDGLIDRRYGALSGGQQRRLQFALALCGRPRLMFLDEPGAGLDIEARAVLWQAIRGMAAAGCAVVLTTHDLAEAEVLADRVAVLARGRIVADAGRHELRARIGACTIRCASALDPARVGAWPGVRGARRDGPRLEIVTDAPEATVRRLLDEDAALGELEVRRAGLAEAFAEITRAAA
jgi:ABC-2 type transport system ATP-binding protein